MFHAEFKQYDKNFSKNRDNINQNFCKISVVMPSLNVAQYIDECMTSVLSQTLKEIEIICVDAGSDDGTLELLQKYGQRDSRIQILHSGIKSYGYQINMGISQAKGKYIAIVETDDFIASDMFKTLYELSEVYDLDYVKAGAKGIKQVGVHKIEYEMKFGDQDCTMMDKVVSLEEYPQILANDYYIWRGIYKRKFLLDHHISCNETQGAAYQDIGFTHLVTLYAKRSMFINTPFYRYRIRRIGSSSQSMKGVKYTYDEYYRLINDCGYLNKISREISEQFWKRFARAALGEINHVLTAADSKDVFDSKYYVWFQDEFKKNIIGTEFFTRIFSEDEQKKIELFAYDAKEYMNLILREMKEQNDNNRTLIYAVNDVPIIIFGSGLYGLSVLELLYENDLKIAGFCDNNEKLWGTEKNGILIYSPKSAADCYPEAAYIVANKEHGDEIANQLRQMNIRKIFIYKKYEGL